MNKGYKSNVKYFDLFGEVADTSKANKTDLLQYDKFRDLWK